jgi:hypothetical protein
MVNVNPTQGTKERTAEMCFHREFVDSEWRIYTTYWRYQRRTVNDRYKYTNKNNTQKKI